MVEEPKRIDYLRGMTTTERDVPGEKYLVAVLAVGLGLLLRLPAWSVLGTTVPFLTFIPAVMLAAWRGGLGPGLLATALSGTAALYFFVEPIGSIEISSATDGIGLLLFFFVGGFISWLTERLHVAQQAEQRLRLLSEQTLAGIGDAVITTDLEGQITFMNAVAQQLTGWSFGEAKGKPLETVFRIVNESTGAAVESPVQKALREGITQGLANHTELIARDGRRMPIDDSGAPIRNENGDLVGAVLVFRDITERRAAERAVEASREELRSTLESLTDAFSALDQDWNITYVNPAAEQLLGRSREELVGKNHWEEFPASRGTIIEESYRRAVAEQQPVRFEHYYAPLHAWLETSAFPTVAGGVSIYFRDITERKLNEERVRESEGRFRAAVSAVSSLLWTNNTQGEMEGEQPGWSGFTGQSYEEYQGYGWAKAVHPDDAQPTIDAWNEAVSEHKMFVFEHRVQRHDGVYRRFSVRAVPVIDDSGGIREWVGVHTDITEEQQLIEKLRESEARFRNLADHAPVIVWVTEANGTCTYLSRSWYEFTGQIEKAVLSFSWLDSTHPDDKAEAERIFMEANVRREPFRLEYRLRRKDGEYRWVIDAAAPRLGPSGEFHGYVGSVMDITERKLAEEELRRTNRELEEFAYVASHDLQEPLRMVNIYTQLLLKRCVPDQAQAQEYASHVQQGVKRMETLIKDLLTYSRTVHRDELPVSTADLAAALSEAKAVLHNRIEESGAIIHAGQLPVVRGDTNQLAHVFQNLLSNSLKYRNKAIPLKVHIVAKQEGSRWVISIRDNGIGFDPKYAEKIFGLFKRLHKDEYPGTGLGLAICQRIVDRYGGRMWAESEPGVGSTFFFSLPAEEVQ